MFSVCFLLFLWCFLFVCFGVFCFGLVSLLHDLSHPHSLHTKDVKFFTCLSERALDLRLRLMSLVRDLVRCLSTMDCLYPRDLPQPAGKNKMLFMRSCGEGYVLGSIDIADAYPTVTQKEPTKVVLRDASGSSTVFGLGKVLPGQRAGAQLWYESITELLCRELSMKQCDSYPNLLVTEDRSCTILLHVDDMMVCGHGKYVDEVLIPTLKRFHRISSEFIRNKWIDSERLTITPHHKHVEQLMKSTGVRSTTRPKRVPGHPLMEEPDDTDQLEAVETGEYRSCVGILLYLANDLPHCQHAIRHLSTGMSKPTKRLKDILRHLVSYLSGTKDVGLALQFKGDNVGVHHQYLENPDVLHLKFSVTQTGLPTKHIVEAYHLDIFVVDLHFYIRLAAHKRWWLYPQERPMCMLHPAQHVIQYFLLAS